MLLTRIEMADLSMAAVDALDVDALAVFVGPERPLQGLAGFADWRLCGLVSRAIREGSYGPDAGESLLLPSGGRLAVPRIFCFGAPTPAADERELAATCEKVCVAMARAGSTSWAGALPAVAGESELPVAQALLAALVRAPPARLVLLGDARSLWKRLLDARQALAAMQLEIVPPPTREPARAPEPRRARAP